MDLHPITSISTPMGEGAIGIVRLSGPQAVEIASGLVPKITIIFFITLSSLNFKHMTAYLSLIMYALV
nr:hypothetical protein [Staphylococcus aureus]